MFGSTRPLLLSEAIQGTQRVTSLNQGSAGSLTGCTLCHNKVTSVRTQTLGGCIDAAAVVGLVLHFDLC